MIHRPLVLIIEDDQNIGDLVALYLNKDNYNTVRATTGEDGIKAFRERRPNLVLLDIGLPGNLDGFDLCQRLRTTSNVPVIFITARDDEIDRVLGFKLGADDYITKPFSPRELVARVDAVLRRTSLNSVDPAKQYEIGKLALNEVAHEVTVDGAPLELTRREYELLLTLIKNRGFTLSRRQLLDLAWGVDWIGDERTIDVHVRQLRAKLGNCLDLRTIRGTGYRLA